jgi:ethanolamine utilization protein EutN
MYLGRVVGCVWSTVKNANLEGQRMLIIQPLTPELANTGQRLICTDYTGAGAGELIYWVRGREASYALLPKEPATDTTVVAIVDSVHLKPVAAPEPPPAAPPAPAPPAKGRKPSRKANSC